MISGSDGAMGLRKDDWSGSMGKVKIAKIWNLESR